MLLKQHKTGNRFIYISVVSNYIAVVERSRGKEIGFNIVHIKSILDSGPWQSRSRKQAVLIHDQEENKGKDETNVLYNNKRMAQIQKLHKS